MIFIGDIACPYNKVKDFTEAVSKIEAFKNEIVILNLEANILEPNAKQRPLTLYNAESVLNGFKESKKVIVSLANNHMYDYPSKIIPTKECLEERGCGVFGLREADGSIVPYEYEDDGRKYAFFGHCWRLYTHSNRNDENDIRISDDYYDVFAESVISYVKVHKNVKVYCFMHWNYDLEKYVMPMHVKLSHYLIDNGVEAVIGSHSHRPQGAEIYKSKAIAYGLGNFYLPSGVYFDGKLTYPECSQMTYALRISEKGINVLWFNTDCLGGGKIVELNRVCPIEDESIAKLSPFVSMNGAEYRRFFAQNRSKKMFVPVFDDYQGKRYKIKESFALNRVKLIRMILKFLKR